MCFMDYNNLEVFILTYNRADFLKIQLESVCKQTAKGFKIRILNNASTDNTLDVIKEVQQKYPEREIEVITHPQNIRSQENFKMSQKLASTEYCAIFHDDDCMHPTYIETAMKCLQKHPDVVMIGSDGDAMYNVNDQNWYEQSKQYLLFDKEEFALLNLHGGRHNFATMIYKSEVYKSIKIEEELCGKIWDLPFTFKIGATGKSILLEGKYIRYRLSAGQDSKDYKTGPFPNEIINALRICKESIINNKFYSLLLLYNFTKMLHNGQKLKEMYDCSWKDFCKMYADMGLFNSKELFIIKFFGYKKVIRRIQKFVDKRKNQIRKSI